MVADRKCGALEVAQAYNVPVKLINFNKEILSTLEQLGNFDLIALCGFKRILPYQFLKDVKVPILNSHPSLLPAYGGRGMVGVKVQEAAIENNEIFAGCTVHFVDTGIDTGNHLIQAKIKIRKNETAWQLGGRIHEVEKVVFWSAITMVLEGLVD